MPSDRRRGACDVRVTRGHQWNRDIVRQSVRNNAAENTRNLRNTVGTLAEMHTQVALTSHSANHVAFVKREKT